ncbi:MAG: alanine racemase [Candidatus Aerophobus sp.]|nr:MAG: alanine racemase [Candidatus Aerophobus sp.]
MDNLGRVWLEIDLDAVTHNIKTIRRIAGKNSEIMAVVKANAYGHDAIEISRVALESGATWLGVGALEEGIILRKAGIEAPILVLGLTPEDQIDPLLFYDLVPTICDLQTVKALSQAAVKYKKNARIHIKIDTGMRRLGIKSEGALDFIKRVKKMNNIEIEGLYTHLAAADEEDKSYTKLQFAQYKRVVNELEKEDIHVPLKHMANSAAILDLPYTYLDIVRPGITIYGLFPLPLAKRTIKLKPVAKFKTKIIFIKKVDGGENIGYGRAYTTTKETTVATLPVGYADGYPRLLSDRGEVLVKGTRALIIGRICMDLCMIDVTNIPGVQVGEEVVLWGRQEGKNISVEEIAEKTGTINYEIICMVDKPRVSKVFIKKGKPFKIKSLIEDVVPD